MNAKDRKKRIEYIDALRAFALFGVIMVHVNQMYSFYNEFNDFSYFTMIGTRCRQVVFWLFDDKSRTIFSTLFGISFYLILRNPSYTNRKFLWRCLLLICFGLIDKLFSSGDILLWYGINGVILSFFPVRKFKPSVLLLISAILFLFSLADMSSLLRVSFPNRYPADTTLAAIMTYPMSNILISDLCGRICIDSTMTLSCFFFGFYLGKSGVIDNIRRYTTIRNCLLTTCLFAASLLAYRLSNYHSVIWRFSVLIGSISLALDFIWLFNHLPQPLAPMTRYGRLGLTNYSSQYIIGTIMVLYIAIPMKLSIEYVFLMGMALYLLQTMFAHIWTSHFKYGPLEWLWRVATNMKYEPLKI